MFKNTFAVVALAVAAHAYAHAQLSILEQEAHRPYLRKPGTDGKTPTGYTPQQMRHAYGVDQITNQGAGQIIGIVDGFDSPPSNPIWESSPPNSTCPLAPRPTDA